MMHLPFHMDNIGSLHTRPLPADWSLCFVSVGLIQPISVAIVLGGVVALTCTHSVVLVSKCKPPETGQRWPFSVISTLHLKIGGLPNCSCQKAFQKQPFLSNKTSRDSTKTRQLLVFYRRQLLDKRWCSLKNRCYPFLILFICFRITHEGSYLGPK